MNYIESNDICNYCSYPGFCDKDPGANCFTGKKLYRGDVEHEMVLNISKWYTIGEVGMSSREMARCLLELPKTESYPRDPSDFNRCLLFLKYVPEARKHMDKFRSISFIWSRLIDNWDKIEQCFLDEAGLNWSKSHKAPNTFKLMLDILRY